nr:Ig-like domain-containing protein [Mycobacterium sp.]
MRGLPPPTTGAPTTSRSRRRSLLIAIHLAILLVMVTAMPGALTCPPPLCEHDANAAHAASSLAPAPPPVPVALLMNPGPNAENVDPLAPVTVTANAGTLLNVSMVNDAGKPVEGVTTPDNTVWKPTVPLGYGRTYT